VAAKASPDESGTDEPPPVAAKASLDEEGPPPVAAKASLDEEGAPPVAAKASPEEGRTNELPLEAKASSKKESVDGPLPVAKKAPLLDDNVGGNASEETEAKSCSKGTREGSKGRAVSSKRDPMIQHLLNLPDHERVGSKGIDREDSRERNRALNSQENFQSTLFDGSGAAVVPAPPCPNAADKSERTASLIRYRDLLASRKSRFSWDGADTPFYEDGVAKAVAAASGVKAAEVDEADNVACEEAFVDTEARPATPLWNSLAATPSASSKAVRMKLDQTPKAEKPVRALPALQRTVSDAYLTVQSEADVLKQDILFEEKQHRKTRNRLEELEAQLNKMQASLPRALPRKRFGVAGGNPYRVTLPLPVVPVAAKSHGVVLPALKGKPVPRDAARPRTTPGADSSHAVPGVDRSASAPVRSVEELRAAADQGDPEALLALSRAERYRARLELIARRSGASTFQAAWELRRAGKVEKLLEVNAFGDSMWDSFLDWKERGVLPATAP
jgi:hypothetical protein